MHLIDGLKIGGTQRMLIKTLPILNSSENKHFVCSVMSKQPMGDDLKAKKIEVYYLNVNNKVNFIKLVQGLKKVIRKEKPDIIYSYLLLSGIIARIFGRLFGVKKIICSVRNKYINSPILNKLEKMTSLLVNKYTPNSETTKKFLIKHIGIKKEKIIVIPNCIETQKFTKRKTNNNPLKKIICVASFKKQKGHEVLINAFKQIVKDDKTITLDLIGWGERETQLKNLVREKKLEKNIHFLGANRHIENVLHKYDLFVLPSFFEGMSNSLMEASVANLPALTSDIPENREVLGQNGYYFKVGNVNDFVKVFEQLKNAKTRKTSYEFVKEHYNLKKTINKQKKVIKECVES